jgi:hypothetical protein
MPSLGQTLCQLEKNYLNQQLGSPVRIFTAEVAEERGESRLFVARQRQHSCLV